MKISKEQFQLLKNAKNSIYYDIKPLFLYHNNKLEGSTFSEEEILNIIENKEISGKHDIDDFYETRNSILVFDYIIDHLGCKIDDNFLIKMNAMLLKDTWVDKAGLLGTYKKVANRITGAHFEVSLPKDVNVGMDDLINIYNYKKKLSLDDIVKFHTRFEHIHPFQDGNGRCGRFLMLKQCIENNQDLIFINSDNRDTYLAWMEAAITQNEFMPLIEFFKDTQKELDKVFEERNYIDKMPDNKLSCKLKSNIDRAKSASKVSTRKKENTIQINDKVDKG